MSVPFRAGGYMSMLGFEKTPDEVIKRLKALGRESFEEYARGMEEKWKAVNCSPFKCPGAAAAAEAEVLTVSELLAYCRKEQGEAFTCLLYTSQESENLRQSRKTKPKSN